MSLIYFPGRSFPPFLFRVASCVFAHYSSNPKNPPSAWTDMALLPPKKVAPACRPCWLSFFEASIHLCGPFLARVFLDACNSTVPFFLTLSPSYFPLFPPPSLFFLSDVLLDFFRNSAFCGPSTTSPFSNGSDAR